MTMILLILVWAATLYVTGTICWFKGFKRGKNNEKKEEEL